MKLQDLAVVLLPSLCLLAGGAAARAQSSESIQSEDSLFSESLEVQGVNVHAVVTGRDGRPVTGLTAGDFRVLVDGEPVPLDFFIEVRDGRAVLLPDGPDAALPADLDHAFSGEPVGTSYLIYVDELFSPIHLRNEALRALADQLDTLGPRDQVAVVAFTGTRLVVLTDWTRSREDLRRLLTAATRHKGSIATAALALQTGALSERMLLEAYPSLYRRSKAESAADLENQILNELARVRQAIYAAAAAQRSFADAPGRKVMLLLSQGWRIDRFTRATGAPELLRRVMSLPGDIDEWTTLLRPLTDTANQLGYTIYPYQLFDRGQLLPDAGMASTSAQYRADRNQILSAAQRSLLFAAEETGGKLLLPGRKDLLPRLAAETGAYYWLGLTQASAASSEGRRRSLELEVPRPGAAVRARTSFLPIDRETRLALELESSLLTGKNLEQAPLEASLGRLRRAGRKTAEVPLAVKIPTDGIAMVERDGRYVARLELRVAALDADGRRSEVPAIPIDISGEKPPVPGGFLTYQTRLKVRRDEQDLQVVLHDVLSGRSAAARLHVARPAR